MVESTKTKETYTSLAVASFSIGFKYFGGDIEVVLTLTSGDLQPLTEGVDYEVTSPGDSGTLSRLTDWLYLYPTAESVTISRHSEVTQLTDLRNGEKEDAELYEAALDKTILIVQELAETVGRGLAAPVQDTVGLEPLPSLEARRGMWMGFDQEGQPAAMEGGPSALWTAADIYNAFLSYGLPYALLSDFDVPYPFGPVRFWYFSADTANKPEGISEGFCIFVPRGTTEALEVVASNSTPRETKIRAYYDGAWSPWADIWTSENQGTESGMDSDMLDGRHAGHASGDVPYSDGTLNDDLNADKLDGADLDTSSTLGGSEASDAKIPSQKAVYDALLAKIQPLGSVYWQGPADAAPSEVWPGTTWSNVSSEEAGLFRRTEGGSASTFGSGTQAGQNKSHNHGGSSGGMSANNPHVHSMGRLQYAGGTPYVYGGTGLIAHDLYTNSADIAHTHSISLDGGADGPRPNNVTVRKWRRTA